MIFCLRKSLSAHSEKKKKNGEKYRSPEGQDNNLVVFFPSDPSLI